MEAKLSRALIVAADKASELLFSVTEIDFPKHIWTIWWKIRERVIVPMVNIVVILCLIMLIMVFVEKVTMGAVSLYAKIFRRRPERIYKCDPIPGDEETGNLEYPMVLVQVPMYNEKEVYQLSIGAACNISWPGNRIIIQVLDDSTDPIIKELVRSECEMWLKKGKNIKYETRDNRNGYKAGALKVGMKYDYVQTCEYVAMFDADFQPAPDFLRRTIPFLVHNPDIALVQTCWIFVNAHECLMTRMQEMSMDYHFKVEQESGSSTFAFFGFNGTAGVWRIQSINDAGGWQDRTTVEDMDLAVRAGLKGWKFVYLGNVKVKSELPSTFKAYRYQQHRWSCGPANLFRKMLWDVLSAKKVSLWKKCYVIYNFFLARRIVSHIVTFFFYCVVIPFTVFFPEVKIPKWGMVYAPVVITLLNCVGTPRSIHLVIFWVFFENVMSLHRCKAVFIGLLEASRVNEWVVTEKLGDLLKSNPSSSIAKRFQSKFWERFHILELVVGIYLLACASYDCIYCSDYCFVYIFPQAISFFIMGFGYIGTIIPYPNTPPEMAVRITTAAAFLFIAAASAAGDLTAPVDHTPHRLDLLHSSTLSLTRSLRASVVGGIQRAFISAEDWIPEEVRSVLVKVRSAAIAPVMRAAMAICLVMSAMLLVEVVYMAAVSFGVMVLRRRPERRYKWEAIGGDEEVGSLAYPMVLVQIPMYNEREVYGISIGAACKLSWPSDRLIIQVLDDSTDLTVKDLVEVECKIWASKGMNIFYEVRDNRKGYKAGALKEGMQYSYVQHCDFVAIFDADFQPESDFLMRTIPFLVHNPRVSLVQARWEFVNANECLMTRIQKMTLDYHFKVEQEAGSSAHAFFGFNGTAGVWRISAINESGGWNDRTTVEDMDLAVRAGLRGWKFIYVGDLKVKSELPSDFKAYRNQQHRWTCGAANLFRKTAKEILTTKEVSVWKKLYVLYSFFFVRKVISHIVTFSLYCVIIPASVMVPEVSIPIWGVVHIPTTITVLNAVRNPCSIHLIPFWILFENVMAMHRIRATLIGLMEAGSANEWVVTEKLGGVPKATLKTPLLEKSKPSRYRDRINFPELGFAFFLFFCTCYDITFGRNYYHIYIFFQSLAFFVVGLGYVGTFISSS